MDASLILLRVIHVVAGTFWVGAVFMTVLFLMKAMADAGPAGGQVMGALIKRRYFDVLPAVAVLTVLSGVDLLRRVSDGFGSTYMGSRTGIVMSVGALAGVIAFAVGASISRPASLGAAALMGKAAAMPDGPEKAALMAQVGAKRARAALSLKAVSGLLAVAVVCMAIARYV